MKKLRKPVFDMLEATYDMVVGKSGSAWFYPCDVPNAGDHILVTDSDDWSKCGEGFGGSTLRIRTTNPDFLVFELRGGWHSNGDSLLKDTGVDLTHKHYTHGRISELDGTLVWEDFGWVLGEFDRVQKTCREIVQKSGVPLLCEVQSMGGSSSQVMYPKNVEEMMQ